MSQQPVIPHGAPVRGSRNLPTRPPEQLLGRESDLASIHLTLKAGTAVLLHGPAGNGKTALAAALAAGYAELPGGVLWLDVRDDALGSLLARVARAYGVLAGDAALSAQTETVRDVLSQQRPLVVLDGQLQVEAAREFARECAPGLPLLLTHSRLVAGPWTPHAVNALGADDAEAMFLLYAERALDLDDPDWSRLIESLGGNALAITIAARLLAIGSAKPGEFLAQMPDLPPGETNRVMGALMAAYRMLPKELPGMALLLGTALAGGASAELLAEASGAPPDAITARMQQLVERGFAAERAVYGQPYFSAHELIQTFAQTFLRGKKQLDATQARHLKSVVAYVQRHAAEATPEHHDRLAAEMPNILAAGLFAAGQGQTDALEALARLLTPASPDSFVVARGFQPELEWLRLLAAQPEAAHLGVLGAPEPEVEAALPEAAPPPETTPEPVELTTEAAQEQPTVPSEAAITAEAPELLPVPESFPESVEKAAAPVVILPSDAESLRALGQDVAGQRDAAAAIAQYAQAAESFHADGNVEDELAALEALATLSLENANYADVLAYVDRGTTLAQETDNPQREGEMLVILGDLQAALGRLDGAETAYKEAINAFRPMEAWLNIGLTLDKLAELYLDQDRLQDAIDIWEQTLPIFERMDRPGYLRESHSKLGAAHAELMRWDRARGHYDQALALARSAQDDQAVFDALADLAAFLDASGDRAGSILHYRRALSRAFDLNLGEELGHTLLALGRLLIDDTVHLSRALQLLQAANERLPGDTEVQRLLRRAKTRQERLLRGGVTLPIAENSVEDYAREADT
jgi:tetratricopeptide (TPR) repeat protein